MFVSFEFSKYMKCRLNNSFLYESASISLKECQEKEQGIWSKVDQELNIGSATCFLAMISLDLSFLMNDENIYVIHCEWESHKA